MSRPGWRRSLSAILLIISAAALQRAATVPWGRATEASGSRIEVTPIGIYRTPAEGGFQNCRWWPATGDASLCRVAAGGEPAFQRLRLGYPLLQVAFWGAIIALFLVVLRVPRQRSVRVVSMLLVAACAIVATLCVILGAPSALAVLADLPLSFGLAGAILALMATAAAATSAGLQLSGD